jgi:hypothetical protein
VYGIKTGAELAQTFKVARCEVSSWPQRAKQGFNPVPLMPRTLHSGGSNPILVEPRSSEKPLNGQGFQNSDDAWRIRSQTSARPFLTTQRNRSERPNTAREAALQWRAPRQIRRTGTKLVQLLQAAWNIR